MDLKKKGEGVDINATFQEIDRRLLALENKVWPSADGSGTDRYDHWTQKSDGTDYPGSYGVGPAKAADSLKAGDSIRVQNADGSVDPAVYVATGVNPQQVTFTRNGGPVTVLRSKVVPVKA